MICVSLADMSFDDLSHHLEHESFVELRLDKLNLTNEQIIALFSTNKKTIATFRPNNDMDDDERKNKLKTAVKAGATYVDIEIESEDDYLHDMVEFAHQHKCQVIISYHNFEHTPDTNELSRIINLCFEHNADIAKIVTTVHDNEDRARILSLYAIESKKKIIAFGMGQKGRITRVIAPLLGGEFTYASRAAGKEVAPGQIDKITLLEKLESLKNL
jgi:3-dehydroquinate dehydratase-1